MLYCNEINKIFIEAEINRQKYSNKPIYMCIKPLTLEELTKIKQWIMPGSIWIMPADYTPVKGKVKLKNDGFNIEISEKMFKENFQTLF